jgi:hypothetical protein
VPLPLGAPVFIEPFDLLSELVASRKKVMEHSEKGEVGNDKGQQKRKNEENNENAEIECKRLPHPGKERIYSLVRVGVTI